MTESLFKSTWDNPPDWSDGGRIELRNGDCVVKANLLIDAWFAGDDEIPVTIVTTDDGKTMSFYDFDEWRKTA